MNDSPEMLWHQSIGYARPNRVMGDSNRTCAECDTRLSRYEPHRTHCAAHEETLARKRREVLEIWRVLGPRTRDKSTKLAARAFREFILRSVDALSTDRCGEFPGAQQEFVEEILALVPFEIRHERARRLLNQHYSQLLKKGLLEEIETSRGRRVTALPARLPETG